MEPVHRPVVRSEVQPGVSGGVQPLEEAGCPTCDPDPSPGAPGIWLGYRNTSENCFVTPGGLASGDYDVDGLRDDCEVYLAQYFAPMLATDPWEGLLGREPLWAARWSTDFGVDAAAVFYMPAYYYDGGTHALMCNAPWPLPVHECDPHWGDSEFVELYIVYNAFTHHWELYRAYLSKHYGTGSRSLSRYINAIYLQYPGKYLGYPRVWVARSKHANYKSQSDCNSGGFLNVDDCSANSDSGRLSMPPGTSWSNRNVGSAVVHYIDQIRSIYYPFSYTGVEYIWQGVPFCGWDAAAGNTRGTCATSYTPHLGDFGY